jgi:hypothetical protein
VNPLHCNAFHISFPLNFSQDIIFHGLCFTYSKRTATVAMLYIIFCIGVSLIHFIVEVPVTCAFVDLAMKICCDYKQTGISLSAGCVIIVNVM